MQEKGGQLSCCLHLPAFFVLPWPISLLLEFKLVFFSPSPQVALSCSLHNDLHVHSCHWHVAGIQLKRLFSLTWSNWKLWNNLSKWWKLLLKHKTETFLQDLSNGPNFQQSAKLLHVDLKLQSMVVRGSVLYHFQSRWSMGSLRSFKVSKATWRRH